MEKVTGFLKAITPRTWIIIAIIVVIFIIIVLYVKNKNKQVALDAAKSAPKVVVNVAPPAVTQSAFPLKQGSKGAEIKVLQSYLNTKGENLTVDGIWGPLTQASVVKVLKVNEISSDLFATLK